jgi:hypothetical protein
MAEMKTKENNENVEKFLNTVEDISKRKDCFEIAELMKKASDFEPKMWGNAIVGFGRYHYKYESGREGDMCLIGFSPRKKNITMYIMAGIDSQRDLLDKLGKHKTSKGCLYINKLSDIDKNILTKLMKNAIAYLKSKYK